MDMQHIITRHALINDTRIAYGVHGAGDPVILVHGTPSSSFIWRNIVPVLTGAGYRTYVYDLLGYGLSERPWDPAIDTSVTGQVTVLEGLMRHWGLAQAHLVAHDIGGGIAQRLGVLSPQYLHTLTMIDVVSYDSWPSKRTRLQMQNGLAALIKAPDGDHREHFRNWLYSTVENKTRLAATSLDTYLDFICNPVGQGSLFQHQVRHYDPQHTDEISDRLDQLGAHPVQLIWGADDGWQAVDWAHRLHAAIPGSELHVLEHCGHFAMEDQPERISALLVNFLDRHRRGDH